jgi:hypothetical protein
MIIPPRGCSFCVLKVFKCFLREIINNSGVFFRSAVVFKENCRSIFLNVETGYC